MATVFSERPDDLIAPCPIAAGHEDEDALHVIAEPDRKVLRGVVGKVWIVAIRKEVFRHRDFFAVKVKPHGCDFNDRHAAIRSERHAPVNHYRTIGVPSYPVFFRLELSRLEHDLGYVLTLPLNEPERPYSLRL